jgi:hypothetical protein
VGGCLPELVCAAEKGSLRYNLPVISKPGRLLFRLRDTARAVRKVCSRCAVMTSAEVALRLPLAVLVARFASVAYAASSGI